jgi:glucose-1-phosphate thymidylyltransferase
MKGIILAGGHGTRLYPLTWLMCKQLLPVYDKPMIYYPLSTLMLARIREILIISTEKDTPHLTQLFGDGSQLGLSLSYAVQDSPRGLADAFLIGRQFIGSDSVCLILGDNIFFGHNLSDMLVEATTLTTGALVFAYPVRDASQYGVVELSADGDVISIEEKPPVPKSNNALVGLYFYDNTVVKIAERLVPSARGEIEITDVNREYLRRGTLKVQVMGRGYAWLDTGTANAIADATTFVRTIEERQGLKIACIEEIAYRMGFIAVSRLKDLASRVSASSYGQYLLQIVRELPERAVTHG